MSVCSEASSVQGFKSKSYCHSKSRGEKLFQLQGDVVKVLEEESNACSHTRMFEEKQNTFHTPGHSLFKKYHPPLAFKFVLHR